MSISPPSFLIRAGRPACISARIAPLCQSAFPFLEGSLCASLWSDHVSCRRSQCTDEMWKFELLGGVTWHWSDLAFIEPSVVKLDCRKVSISDISSFNTALWCEKLHELI